MRTCCGRGRAGELPERAGPRGSLHGRARRSGCWARLRMRSSMTGGLVRARRARGRRRRMKRRLGRRSCGCCRCLSQRRSCSSRTTKMRMLRWCSGVAERLRRPARCKKACWWLRSVRLARRSWSGRSRCPFSSLCLIARSAEESLVRMSRCGASDGRSTPLLTTWCLSRCDDASGKTVCFETAMRLGSRDQGMNRDLDIVLRCRDA